jgi:hypothetical protein
MATIHGTSSYLQFGYELYLWVRMALRECAPMHPELKRFLSPIFGVLSVPVLLAVGLSPILVPLFLIEFFSDGPSDLDSACEPRFIQEQAVAFVAPNRFWARQDQAFTLKLERPFVAPSAHIREEQAKLMQTLAEVRQALPPPPPRSRPEALRAEADRIEHEQTLRLLDESALNRWQQERAHAQRCLAHARAQLARR